MRKKAALIVAFLAVFLIGSVMAAPKEKNLKEKNSRLDKTAFANMVVLTGDSSSPGEQVTTETGILYVNDALAVGSIVSDSDSPISGSVWARLSGTMDLNTMLGSFNGKWTITTTDGGTFQGSVTGIVEVASVSGRFVGRGIGGLEGQKIKGSFEGTVDNYIVYLTIQGDLSSK